MEGNVFSVAISTLKAILRKKDCMPLASAPYRYFQCQGLREHRQEENRHRVG